MADKDIQPGDDVQWNWGGGHPSGTVAEVNSDAGGKLEISTAAGKTVHKNADPSNPAVHVERQGNDVVKRASELEKISEGGDNHNAAAHADADAVTSSGGGGGVKETPAAPSGGEQQPESTVTHDSTMKDAAEESGALKSSEAQAGEKRERDEDGDTGTGSGPGANFAAAPELAAGAHQESEDADAEVTAAEKEAGKQGKKPKLDEAADAGTTPVEAHNAPESAAADEKELKEKLESKTTTNNNTTTAKRGGRGSRGKGKTTPAAAPTRTSARNKKTKTNQAAAATVEVDESGGAQAGPD